MSTANQQTLEESGNEGRPPILEKGSYVPGQKLIDDPKHRGELMRYLIDNGPLKRKLIDDPKHPVNVNLMCASRAKQNAKNHDPLALVANSHASPSYSCSPQPYNVTHLSFVHDYDDDYQGEIQGDTQEDKLSTKMMNGNRNTRRLNGNQETTVGNGFAQKNMETKEKGHYARDFPEPRICDAKYFREQMLLTKKDEVGVNLDIEENDFMLMNAYSDDQLEELIASVIMMTHIQPTDNKLLSKGDHEQRNHAKLETIKCTFFDDKIDSNIIFDDPYVEDNSGNAKHDQDAHDQNFVGLISLINNVQVEAENQRRMNTELKRKNALVQRELETYKERV
ncbi:hypothetical protein Tco_0741429 [Tanacetum coccineum]